MHLAISICILAADQENFRVGNGQCTTGPQRILHAYREHDPLVLLNFILFYGIINFLLSAPKEASEGVDVLVTDRARTQIVSLVLHGRHLSPLVFADIVALDRAQPLLAREAAEDEDSALADCDGVRITRLSHLCLVQDLVLLGHVDPRVLLRRRATARDQDLCRRESN